MSDKKKFFLEYIALHKSLRENEQIISDAGLEILEFLDDYYALADKMMRIAFNKEQVDWIEWWLYEPVEKVAYHTKPKKKSYRLDTPEQLWDYLQNHCGSASPRREFA